MNTNILVKSLLLGFVALCVSSCLKDPDFDEYVPEDTNIYYKDSLWAAKDTSVPFLFGIDADADGYNDCQLVLSNRGDSITYTAIRLAKGTFISIDTVLKRTASPLLFAKNYAAGDTIRKTDIFQYDSVMLAYKNTSDPILGTIDYKQNVGVKTVVVFKKVTVIDTYYWWLELKLEDYSKLRLIRHSIPDVVILK